MEVKILKEDGVLKLIIIPTKLDEFDLSSVKEFSKGNDFAVQFIEGQTKILGKDVLNPLIISSQIIKEEEVVKKETEFIDEQIIHQIKESEKDEDET